MLNTSYISFHPVPDCFWIILNKGGSIEDIIFHHMDYLGKFMTLVCPPPVNGSSRVFFSVPFDNSCMTGA